MTKWLDFAGRKVKRITFPFIDSNTQHYVESDDDCDLVCEVEYLGDRTEAWVVVLNSDGNEMARHSVRLAESIVWEPL